MASARGARLERHQPGDDPSLAWLVPSTLAHHPHPETLALREQLQMGVEDSVLDVEELVDQMRQKLGLAVESEKEVEEGTGSDDW